MPFGLEGVIPIDRMGGMLLGVARMVCGEPGQMASAARGWCVRLVQGTGEAHGLRRGDEAEHVRQANASSVQALVRFLL